MGAKCAARWKVVDAKMLAEIISAPRKSSESAQVFLVTPVAAGANKEFLKGTSAWSRG